MRICIQGGPIYRIAMRTKVSPDSGCWEYMGSRANGYGRVKIDGSSRLVHRVVYQHLVGPIPPALEPDHLCRNRACCNPDHLELVTGAENARRGRNRAVTMERHASRTHCKRDHEFTQENTRIKVANKGYRIRVCRTCEAERPLDIRRHTPAIAGTTS